MSQHDPDRPTPSRPPIRWVDVAAGAPPATGASADVECRIGALFAKVPAPSAFDANAQARVAARVLPAAAREGAPGRAWVRRRMALGLALGAVVLLISGAVIAGGGVRVWWNRLRREPAAVSAAGPAAGIAPAAKTRRSSNDVSAVPAPDEAATAPSPPLAERPPVPEETPPEETTPVGAAAVNVAPAPAPHHPAPRPRRRVLAARQVGQVGPPPVAGPAQAAPREDLPAGGQNPLAAPLNAGEAAAPRAPEPFMPPPSSSWMPAPDPAPRPARGAPTTAPAAADAPSQLSLEARLLNQAMVHLRQRRDGAAALATLNEYFARYPRGMLAGEARGARIDALLLLQRKNEALRALDAARLEPVGRGQELLVIRGELRARRNCADAIRDFEQVLDGAVTAPAPLQERALFGRAVCRQRQGDEQAARADAAAYLARFPDGRFAASVRRLGAGEPAHAP